MDVDWDAQAPSSHRVRMRVCGFLCARLSGHKHGFGCGANWKPCVCGGGEGVAAMGLQIRSEFIDALGEALSCLQGVEFDVLFTLGAPCVASHVQSFAFLHRDAAHARSV